MKKLLLTPLMILFCAVLSFSQSYEFRTMATKGENEFYDGSQWKDLKTGVKILQNNKIKVKNNCYAGLMHKSGKTIEIKTPGIYDVSKLEGMIKSKASSYSSKYGNFVMNSSEESGQQYNVTGSVERGDASDIMIMGTDEVNIIQDIPLTITWMPELEEDVTYKVEIQNSFNDTVYFAQETKNNSVELDFSALPADESEMPYLILLYVDGKMISESNNKKVFFVDEKKAEKIKKERAKLMKELNPSTSPLDNLIMASFYDENGLEGYAISSIKRAHLLAPDVDDYNNHLTSYLAEKGMLKKIENKK